MPLIIILVLAFSLFLVGVGVKNSFSQPKNEEAITSQKISNSSFAETEKMLAQIDPKEAPEERISAMCYDIAPPVEYQEYVCPIDGQKTVYSKDVWDTYRFMDKIVEMERLVESINSLTDLAELKLDEKRLCHTCYPNLKTSERYVSLITKYPNGKKYRYEKILVEDLQMLREFFEKKLNHETGSGQAISSKKELERIRKILGIKISLPTKEDQK